MTPADPGDDSVVLRVVAAWHPDVKAVLAAKTGINLAGATPERQVALNIQRGDKRQHHFLSIGKDGWYLVKLGPGVWDISPSLAIPGQIHAFVTVVNVPEPAPWDRGYQEPIRPKTKTVWVAKCPRCLESETSNSSRRERLCVQCKKWIYYEETEVET